jgi:hypothetical protein
VQCSHCSQWLHARCLEVRASEDALKQTQPRALKKKSRPSKRNKANGEDAPAFEAQLSTSDTSKTRLTVTDKREGQNNRQWDVDIPCLMCGKIIEKAEDDSPEEAVPQTPVAQTGDDALEDEEVMDATALDTPFVSNPPVKDVDQDVAIKEAPTSDTTPHEPEPEPEPEPVPVTVAATKGETSTEPSSSDQPLSS